jgi:hypothetical protein
MRVRADLVFQVDVPGRSADPTRCTGRVQADGQEITVRFSTTPSLGGSSTRPLVRPLAAQLERLGLTVSLVGPDGPLLRLGAGVRAPRWQWVATRSSRIELLSVRTWSRSLRGPRLFEAALPTGAALPAVTHRQRTHRRRVAVALCQAGRRLAGGRRR